jgi:integral membrane sensor domain MASE1
MSVTAVESIPRQVADLGRHLQGPLLAAALYYLGAEAAFFVGTLSDRIFAPFWPPNIVLFCALLLSPSRQWWLFVLAAFPAHVFAELSVGMGVAQLLVAFATNCAFALIGAVAAQRLLQGPPWFGTLQKACLYVLITVIVTPMLVAVGGAFVPVMSAGSAENYWTFWAQWYLSNAVGSVALGPIALFLFGERHGGLFGERHVSPQIPARVIVECVLLALTLIVVCVVSFETSDGHSKQLPAGPHLLAFALRALGGHPLRFKRREQRHIAGHYRPHLARIERTQPVSRRICRIQRVCNSDVHSRAVHSRPAAGRRHR